MLSRVWRLLTECVDSRTWGWCTCRQLLQVYIEGMASMTGETHAKTPHDTRNPTRATDRQRVFRAIVEKAQWILRARRDVLYAVKELSRRLQGPREVDYVAAKRLVKYLHGTRDTALQLKPRKGTMRLDSASHSD